VKRVIAVVLSVGLAVVASPAQAAEKLVDARLRYVRLLANGSVRVAFEYVCPGRYDYRALGFPATLLTVYQIEASGHQVYAQKTFRDAVVCDGTMQTLIRSFRPPEGETFDPALLLTVELDLTVRSDSDPYPGTLRAREVDTFSLTSDGAATRAADLRVEGVRLNDRGMLVFVVSYRCPTGWFVDVADDSDWADIAGVQNRPGLNDPTFWAPLGDDIVCDDASHVIVKRLSDQQGIGFTRSLPVQFEAKMILDEVGSQRYMTSSEGQTLLVA